jgi:hypothetical protein
MTTKPTPEHDPCCSSHGVPMDCERYRRTHFVEVRPCCAEDAQRLATDGAHPCPHGCENHTVPSLNPTACGHYHSPTEWGHHEDQHNSDYWAAIGKAQS